MNVADFALRVTHAIGIDAATANSATSAEYTLFLSWLNEGVVQFLRRTKVFKRTASLDLTADQYDYTLDTDILSFEDVTYEPSGGTNRALIQVDSSEIRSLRLLSSTATSDPAYFAYEGQIIMLFPTPRSSSDNLHILYVPRPTAMTTVSQAPSTTAYGGIPEEYHPELEAYVKWKAAEHANDQASGNGQLFKQEFEAGCVAARVAEIRKAGLRLGGVSLGRPRLNRFATPGVDLG